jgi:hypothetical protein
MCVPIMLPYQDEDPVITTMSMNALNIRAGQ